jgi:tetratricopeptide (TPR) repeat protein
VRKGERMKRINYKKISTLIENKQFVEAEEVLKDLIKKHPKEAKAHFLLGVVYSYNKQTELSIKQYKKTILLDSNYADAYFHLGMIYEYSRDEWKKAEGYYKETIKRNVKESQAFINLANIWWTKQGELDKPIELLKEGLLHNPNDEGLYHMLGLLYEDKAKWCFDASNELGFKHSNKIMLKRHAKNRDRLN